MKNTLVLNKKIEIELLSKKAKTSKGKALIINSNSNI